MGSDPYAIRLEQVREALSSLAELARSQPHQPNSDNPSGTAYIPNTRLFHALRTSAEWLLAAGPYASEMLLAQLNQLTSAIERPAADDADQMAGMLAGAASATADPVETLSTVRDEAESLLAAANAAGWVPNPLSPRPSPPVAAGGEWVASAESSSSLAMAALFGPSDPHAAALSRTMQAFRNNRVARTLEHVLGVLDAAIADAEIAIPEGGNA